MTDPVILYGTQSTGETLPVQVDAFGRLVAEGLQGPTGPPGADGEPGPPGGAFALPPDPYEGAVLGWLDGTLAWLGTPPVPIPPGVFGPILSWDSQSLRLTVEGEIPAEISTGVYVYQCNEDGTYYTDGWNVSKVWSADYSGSPAGNQPITNMYDGTITTAASGQFVSILNIPNVVSLRVNAKSNGAQGLRIETSGGNFQYNTDLYDQKWIDVPISPGETLINVQVLDNSTEIFAVEASGELLVDTTSSLNLRVDTVGTGELIGTPSTDIGFTVGKYLYVPQQRVARWVYEGEDFKRVNT